MALRDEFVEGVLRGVAVGFGWKIRNFVFSTKGTENLSVLLVRLVKLQYAYATVSHGFEFFLR